MKWKLVSILMCTVLLLSGCTVPWQKEEEIIYDARIVTLNEIRDEHTAAAYEKYKDQIGETVPGKRIVECIDSGVNRDYSVYEFDDHGFTHEFYLFAFDFDTYDNNQKSRIESVEIAKGSLECDNAFRVVHFKQNYVDLGENGYNFVRQSIMNEYKAEAEARDVELSEVRSIKDSVGRNVSIVGELSEYTIPKPKLEQDDEGYMLAATDDRFFKYKKLLDGSVEITAYLGDEGNRIVFPEYIDEQKVTVIGELEPVAGITSVVVPGSIKKLDNSFKGWTELNQLVLLDGVEEIGTSTIQDTAITQLTFPNSIKVIGEDFYVHNALTEYKFPASLTNTAGLFRGCGVETIIIPGSVKTVGEGSFENCGLLTTVFIEEGVEIISKNAFKNCSALQAIAIPKSVKKIDTEAFDGCNPMLVVPVGSYAEAFAIGGEYTYSNQ